MERVRKQDLAMYNEKNNNVATVRGAFGRFAARTLTIAMAGVAVLLMAINDICKQNIEKGAYENSALLVCSIILLAIAATITITRFIMLKDPNIYFIGNDMYIKENKDSYLKISPQDLEEYGWTPITAQNYAGARNVSRGHSSCSYYGYLNLAVDGVKYKLSCNSMKKAKHYLDGFLNGVSVKENNFDGDPLRALNLRAYSIALILACMVAAFCYLMLFAVNETIAIISIILFAGSLLTGIILTVRAFVKIKVLIQMEEQYFEEFVINQPIKLKTLDERDSLQSDDDDI